MKKHVATLALLGLVATFGMGNQAQASPGGKGEGYMERHDRGSMTDRALRSDVRSDRERKDNREDECVSCEMNGRAHNEEAERYANRGRDDRRELAAARDRDRDLYAHRTRGGMRERVMRSHPNDRAMHEVLI